MSREQYLSIAERNLKKAQKNYEYNYNRNGVTESERESLVMNVEYAQYVYDMLCYM